MDFGLGEENKDDGYNRDDEKKQEIGDEFLNPDEEMEEAVVKIQSFYRGKKDREKVEQKKQ